MRKTDCCAKCYYLRFVQVNSKQHFFCLNKCKEITNDNISYCKDFVDSDKYQELLKRIKKYSKLFYNLVWKEHKHKELDEQNKKDLELLYNLPYRKDDET